ncbi:hypothetical protein FOL47_000220 [Perkinsus chesapeaki]|uniref:Tyr recombinase domain-containing protein n=1 Tax=Perkinsus chesapeaki TaxID=330153 RepID=A0A7J6KWJ5_PERCH|nr:hypothetical protein FOL47_000220 [Perkinsus chesapeaki]
MSASSISGFVSTAYAQSTHKQIETAQRFYVTIVKSKRLSPTPVTIDSLTLMICCMARSEYKFSTITKYLSHVQRWAIREGILVLSEQDKLNLNLALRAAKKLTDGPTRQAATLSKSEIESVVVALDVLSPVAADLFILGTVGLLRVGEALALKAGHINPAWFTIKGGNATGIIVFINKSKTDIGGQGSRRPIPCTSLPPTAYSAEDTVENKSYLCQSPLCAAHRALRRSRLADSPDDALFNISREAYSTGLRKAMSTCLGSTDINASTHSMRRSGASTCFSAGWSLQLLGEYGRWSSSECLDKIYLRNSHHRIDTFADNLYETWHP